MIQQANNSNDFGHEVFISYASADNQNDDPSRQHWIDSFIDLLQKCLRRVPGLDDSCSIWTDEQLAADGPYTPQLITRLENTPIFEIVLSPNYLRSEWCASPGGQSGTTLRFVITYVLTLALVVLIIVVLVLVALIASVGPVTYSQNKAS